MKCWEICYVLMEFMFVEVYCERGVGFWGKIEVNIDWFFKYNRFNGNELSINDWFLDSNSNCCSFFIKMVFISDSYFINFYFCIIVFYRKLDIRYVYVYWIFDRILGGLCVEVEFFVVIRNFIKWSVIDNIGGFWNVCIYYCSL